MLLDEGLQLRDHAPVPSERELCLDPRLERRQVQLLEARDLVLGELLVRKLRKGRPTPERERVGQTLEVAALDRPFEAAAVQLASLDAEQVTGAGA